MEGEARSVDQHAAPSSGGQSHQLLLLLGQQGDVEVTAVLEPRFVGLDTEVGAVAEQQGYQGSNHGEQGRGKHAGLPGQAGAADRRGWAVPSVSMPTSQVSAEPARSGSQLTTSLILNGYTPARGKPTMKRPTNCSPKIPGKQGEQGIGECPDYCAGCENAAGGDAVCGGAEKLDSWIS